MKTIGTLILILFLVISSFAQDTETKNNKEIQTLFGKDISHGGYGAIMFNYSQINGTDAFLMGARGGWTIDHVITIGAGGYGFINNINMNNDIDNGYNFDLAGGYGGLLLEGTLFPKSPVHVSIPVLIGAGGVAKVNKYTWDEWDWDYYHDDADAFFVIEPGIEVEFNVVKCMRLAFLFSYRYTRDVYLADIDSDVLNTFNYGMVLKFGKF